MIIWIIWLLFGATLELVAIRTGEKRIPTLSRTLWRLFRLEDRGFDRAERIVRWILTIVMLLGGMWGIIHIAWGPCAFGLC